MANRLPLVMGPNGRFSELPAGDFVAQALWTKLATAVASNSATIDFTGLSSSYNAYKVVLSNVAPATDGVTLWMRTSTDGGSTYADGAGSYDHGSMEVTWTGVVVGAGSSSDVKIILSGSDGIGNNTNEALSGVVDIYRPSAAAYCFVTSQLAWAYTSNNVINGVSAGRRLAAADVDAIRFLMSSGNIASGQFDLYGLAF